jgi:D-alanyl-lipoteichoic acid acyltransferase DltB (MBOAT superfamily)
MIACHAYTIWASDITKFDHTGTQMVITMKLTSFAYNLYDGTFDRKRVFETVYEDRRKARVYAGRKRFAVEGMPSLLEFLGYVYCFPSMIAGPAFEYMDYKRSLSQVVFNLKGAIVPPSNATMLSLRKLAIGLFFLVLHLAVGQFVHYDMIHDPAFIASHGIAYRLGYTVLLLYQIRFKYYFLWKVSEGACIMAHLGFEGYDSEGKQLGWGEVDNIDILATETASSLQGLSRAWNKRTQGWLERYTYNRSGNNLILVYFVSAIWHGLYAGYFIFFLTVAFASMVERLTQAKLNPIFLPSYDGKSDASAGNGIVAFLYWNVCRLSQMLTMTYVTMAFALHKWEKVYRVYQSYNHFYHILLIVAYVVLTVIPAKKVKKDKTA